MENRFDVHRAVVVVDVESYGDPGRTDDDRVVIRDGMHRAVEQAVTEAGIPWHTCDRQDCGDGILVLVPPEVAKSRLVDPLPDRLVAALRRHNARSAAAAQIRMRVALDAGELRADTHGFAGEVIIRASRLLDAPVVKSALAASPGVLAVIASGWFYREIIRHEPAARPDCYREV